MLVIIYKALYESIYDDQTPLIEVVITLKNIALQYEAARDHPL